MIGPGNAEPASRGAACRPDTRVACANAVLIATRRSLAQGKDAIAFLESLVVGDIAGLADGTGSLSCFTNEKGGIIDDTVITKVRSRGRSGRVGPGGLAACTQPTIAAGRGAAQRALDSSNSSTTAAPTTL